MPSFTLAERRPSHTSYRAREQDLYADSDKKPLVLPKDSHSISTQSQIGGSLPPSPAETVSFESSSSPPLPPKSRPHKMAEPLDMHEMDRGAPGDQAIFSDRKTPEQRELARRKSQYYSDAFAHREPLTSPRERVGKESVVMVDVRTNVIVHDEYTFITDLSYSLSTRYQRPESSILVTLTHSACLLLGGSFEPAYLMTITALPSQIQPATNKRNAALLQRGMEDALGVAPQRGIIKFEPVPEANLANNGKTVLGEIEELEKEACDEPGVSRSLSKVSQRSATKSRSKRQSLRSLRSSSKKDETKQLLDKQSVKSARLTPDSSDRETTPPVPPMPNWKSTQDLRAEKAQKVNRRRSFMAAMFGGK